MKDIIVPCVTKAAQVKALLECIIGGNMQLIEINVVEFYV